MPEDTYILGVRNILNMKAEHDEDDDENPNVGIAPRYY